MVDPERGIMDRMSEGKQKESGLITTEKHDEVTVVAVGADLDAHRSQKAKDLLGEIIKGGTVRLVVDLSSVAFVDSAGLGALVSALKSVRPSGGDVRICGARPEVTTVFELTRMTKIFRIFPDRESALASFRTDR